MKYHFAIQCHNFQRRLCWMLSSIVQQTIWPFDIIVDIACRRENGNPTTESIAEAFNAKGLHVQLTYIDDDNVFARRGLVRNIQIKNAKAMDADYMFFADADNVYHPEFFGKLNSAIKKHGSKIHNCIYSRNKQHCLLEPTNDLIESSIPKLPYIENAFERALVLPVLHIPPELDKSGAAAGCMQVVALQDILTINKGRYISPFHKLRDNHLFYDGQRARSDIQFRNAMGGSTRLRLPLYIHLQHIRDKELGHHTEEQR